MFSAYIKHVSGQTVDKSLMKRIMRRGPNINPWGTPEVTLRQPDLQLLIDTDCVQWDQMEPPAFIDACDWSV